MVQRECKDWNAYLRQGGKRMHFVITLANDVSEHTPPWPGQPDTALWTFPDVVASIDAGEDAPKAMHRTLLLLRRRIELLASLPIQGAERSALRNDIRDLGRMH